MSTEKNMTLSLKKNGMFIFPFLLPFIIAIECADPIEKDFSHVLQGTFWKSQALQDIIPYWSQHAVGRQNPAIHDKTAYRWIQAYGNMFNLCLYRITENNKYITYFKKKLHSGINFL